LFKLYFEIHEVHDLNFLDIYPTEKGPIMYYKGELFPLKKDCWGKLKYRQMRGLSGDDIMARMTCSCGMSLFN
jgi:hypothetical protein